MSMEEDISIIGAKLTQIGGTIGQLTDDQYIANLDIANLNAKITSQGQNTMANSTPVVIASDQTPIPVSGAFSVIGGATSANQTNGTQRTQITDGVDNALVTAAGEQNVLATAQPGVDIGDVTVNNAAGAAAVNIQDGGNSITVDGTVAVSNFPATQPISGSVTVNNAAGASAVNIQDGGNSITVDGPLTDAQLRATAVPVSGTVTSIAASSTLATYAASITGLVPVATPTDIFEIAGSATKTIKVSRIRVTGNRGTSGTHDLILVRRSTANTGGTSTTPTRVPADSTSAAATAVVKAYTANPTVGTLIGNIRADKQFLATAGMASSDARDYDFGVYATTPIILRGTAESVSINLNSVTMAGGSLDIWVIWTEE